METRQLPDFSDFGNIEAFAGGPIVGGYKWNGTFGQGSTLTRYTILRADSLMVNHYQILFKI
jgi:hypothetical protein